MSSGRWSRRVAAALLWMLVAGCTAPGRLSVAEPPGAAPKSIVVAAHEAGIYIIRSERVGGAIPLEVLIDGNRIGATVARSYLYAAVSPGVHMLESRGDIRSTLEVETKAGTITYVSQVVEMQYLTSPRTRLRTVHAAQGQEWVRELKAAPPR